MEITVCFAGCMRVCVRVSVLFAAVSTLTTAAAATVDAVVVIAICQALFSLNAAAPFHMG